VPGVEAIASLAELPGALHRWRGAHA